MNKRILQVLSIIVAVGVIALAVHFIENNGNSGNSSPLIVYSADAYVQETSALLNSYHNASGVAIAPVKGGGSLTDATEIGQGVPSNVFVSVSLASYNKSYLQSRYSGWAVAFAADQMVIAYSSATTQNSTANKVISQFSNASKDNSTSLYNSAFTNLTSGKVKVGIANPESDPAGSRGWLVLEIAGYEFHNHNTSYYTDMMGQNHGNVTQSDAAQLVSPLINGQIQFLFIYKSAATVKGLNYVQLPSTVNLGSVSYSGFYSNFSYNLTSGSVKGSPIYLYVTALNGSANMEAALGFSEYILNNTASLKSYGLTPVKPALLYNSVTPPSGIESMVKSGNISSTGGI